MRCVGIDPACAKPVALAWRFGKQWQIRSVPWDDTANLFAALSRAKADGCDTCVIEDGFVGKNPKTALALAVVRGQLSALAVQAGLQVRMVHPATWQAACLTQGRYRPQTHAEIVKQVALRMRGHYLSVTEDEGVAVCIAEWGDGQQGE